MIGLVDDHQSRRRGDDLFDGCALEQIAGRIVGPGQEDDRRLIALDGLKHGIDVQRKIPAGKRHPGVAAAGGLGDQAVHGKPRFRCQQRHVRAGHSHGNELDQFVGPIPQYQRLIGGQAQCLAQLRLECVCGSVGITVECGVAQ